MTIKKKCGQRCAVMHVQTGLWSCFKFSFSETKSTHVLYLSTIDVCQIVSS